MNLPAAIAIFFILAAATVGAAEYTLSLVPAGEPSSGSGAFQVAVAGSPGC